jgi:hypothetical protein
MAMLEESGNRRCKRQARGPAQDGSGETPTGEVLVGDHAKVEEVEEEVEAANVYSDTVGFAAGLQYAYV